MILVKKAAEEQGWDVTHWRENGFLGSRGTLRRGEHSIDFAYDSNRKARGRMYRGNALAGILSGQRAMVEHMTEVVARDAVG